MTRHAAHFEEFEPHTRLKHAILDTYVVAWAMKLLMSGRAGEQLAIVDAFAGAGRDKAGNEGSPLIAVKRAGQAMADARGKKPHLRDPKVTVFAIEKNVGRFKALQQTLTQHLAEPPGLVQVLNGELADHIDGILKAVGNAPTFFFLDPFGIKGLDANTYPKALFGRYNEVFALFSDIGAVRLHGLVTAERADASPDVEKIMAAPSLFPEYDAAEIEAAQEGAALANEALDASIPDSRQHLTRALGGEEWLPELERTAPQHRADTFLRLFREALLRAGARYILTVPMRNDAGRRVYALVHASKSSAGFETMKESVSSGLKHSELSDKARTGIMDDLSVNVAGYVKRLRQVLAGRSIAWADDRHGLRALLLSHTPLFHFQAEEIKQTLKAQGILRTIKRKQVCVFPSVD